MASKDDNGKESEAKRGKNNVVIRYKDPILKGIKYILIPLARANQDEIERQVIEWMIEAEVYSREVFEGIMEHLSQYF